jgi:hypothetical protein
MRLTLTTESYIESAVCPMPLNSGAKSGLVTFQGDTTERIKRGLRPFRRILTNAGPHMERTMVAQLISAFPQRMAMDLNRFVLRCN